MTRHETRREIEDAIETAHGLGEPEDLAKAAEELIQHARGSDFALQAILETLGESGFGVLMATVGRQAQEVEQARLDVDMAAQSVASMARELELAESNAARNWKVMYGYWDAIESATEFLKPLMTDGPSINQCKEALVMLNVVPPRDVVAARRAAAIQQARRAAGFTEADAPTTTQPEENANAI